MKLKFIFIMQEGSRLCCDLNHTLLFAKGNHWGQRLDRYHLLVALQNAVVNVTSWNSADWFDFGPIQARVRMRRRGVAKRERVRKGHRSSDRSIKPDALVRARGVQWWNELTPGAGASFTTTIRQRAKPGKTGNRRGLAVTAGALFQGRQMSRQLQFAVHLLS